MSEAIWHKMRRSYEKVDLFIAPSQFMADIVRTRIGQSKTKVIRNGIDGRQYSPNYSHSGYYLYFGRLSKEKGVETLLHAHHRTGVGLSLKVAGTGPLEKKLRHKYPDIDFLGYRSGQDLVDLIAHAAFVVVPSECYENCSMTILEAMALGKPVIGSRVGGIPEQVEDGKTGLLFDMGSVDDLAEKLSTLWPDNHLQIQMGRAARKKLETEYSLESHCRDLLEIYQKLLS